MLKNVGIIGSGNWGSTIAKIVASNIKNLDGYNSEVKVWVFEEMINGEKLTEIINTRHENVKYLEGIKLPENVVAVPDLADVTKTSDVLVFVLPHQFLPKILPTMKTHLKPKAVGISLIKGLDVMDEASGNIRLVTDAIRSELGITCAALMGANLAYEVAKENYCEATIGCNDKDLGRELKALFHTEYFRIGVTTDEAGVELCGALKNIVATGAGFSEGLGYGDNTKAAVIRLGFMEMIKFIKTFYGDRGVLQDTFFESCGVADLITTCYGGRNRKIAMAFVKERKPIPELEKELLNGQSAQGPLTAAEVNMMLKSRNLLDQYPLFTAVHDICSLKIQPEQFIDCLKSHPEHM